MQEFAHENTTPPAPPGEHWPTAEELAAYIDGTLSKAEAKRITDHLALCEECYEVYAETLRFQLDSSPASPEDNIVPFRRRSSSGHGAWWWRSVAAAAAMVIVGLGGGGYWFFLAQPPALKTEDFTAPIPGSVEPWLGPVMRGEGSEGEEIPIDPASFQIGAQLVNLQVKLRANQGGEAQNVVAQTLQVLRAQTALPVGELDAGYSAITGAIENGTPPRNLVTRASELAREAKEIFDPDHLDFGQWVEAGKLATQARTSTYFRQPEVRSYLRRLLWRQKLGLGETKIDPAALQSLEDIDAVLGKGGLGSSDYAKLNQGFTRILEIYYPQS